MERNEGKEYTHIFPAEYGLALAAIDVSHGVVACSHLTVIRFTFDNVNPVYIHSLASTRHDRDFIRVLHVFEQVGASMLTIECLRMRLGQ
jgi:hypothetical protein